ncbi:MAG TPA: hypothetical protein VIA18_23540 [Polyangia bacterium]|jgi:hypothetical protein|nr:hypothetical protein [Polyangia bacterium]
MERCTNCRFLFEPSGATKGEPATADGIEDCPQCEGTTVILVESIEADFDSQSPPTLKFGTVRE